MEEGKHPSGGNVQPVLVPYTDLRSLHQKVKRKSKSSVDTEKEFYSHIEFFIETKSGSLLMSDFVQINRFVEEFELILKDHADNGGSASFYEGFLMRVLAESKETLNISI